VETGERAEEKSGNGQEKLSGGSANMKQKTDKHVYEGQCLHLVMIRDTVHTEA
jgi:hypothetical protein